MRCDYTNVSLVSCGPRDGCGPHNSRFTNWLFIKMKNGLILGLDGAGKTLLLRHLTTNVSKSSKSVVERIAAAVTTSPHSHASQSPVIDLHSINDSINSETQPTIGVEHTPLTIDSKTFTICEVGGQLLPMWKAYFDANEFWIYVVDVSDPAQIAGAAIEFMNIMRNDSMRSKPKLLLLNKIDATHIIEDSILQSYFRLDRFMADAFNSTTPSGPMHVLKVSALTGENMDGVSKWISQRWSTFVNPGSNGPTFANLMGRRILSSSD